MISDFRILPFNTYVLRIPLLPLSSYLNTVEDYSVFKARQLYQNQLIREAINLASPDLVKELDK